MDHTQAQDSTFQDTDSAPEIRHTHVHTHNLKKQKIISYIRRILFFPKEVNILFVEAVMGATWKTTPQHTRWL